MPTQTVLRVILASLRKEQKKKQTKKKHTVLLFWDLIIRFLYSKGSDSME